MKGLQSSPQGKVINISDFNSHKLFNPILIMNDQIRQNTVSKRLVSLDALRGLDMFFLVAIGPILRSLPQISDNSLFKWLAYQCTHPEWYGFTAWDLVFPMFIFVVGAAMPFSFTKRLNQEGGKRRLIKHVLIRSIVLSVLGVVLWTSPGGPHPVWGYYSVLYRIGFAYFFAAVIMMNTSIRGQIYWAFGILIGYWLLLRYVSAPGSSIADFSQEGSLATYTKSLVAEYISPNFQNVFSITLIPSIPNALLGVLAGHWLLSDRKQTEKALGLLTAGIGSIIVGLIIHLDFPIVKNLWSTSYTFLTCGISAVFLSLFYWLIDVKGYKRWAFFFVVVGVNSITIYVANSLLRFNAVASVFVGGIELGDYSRLALALTAGAVMWLFLYYLYHQKYFFKI